MQIKKLITKDRFWSFAAGAVFATIFCFAVVGVMTQGKADRLAREKVDVAITEAMAPVCASNFLRQADAPAQLAALKKKDSWDGRKVLQEGKFADTSGIAERCRELLVIERKKT